MEQDKYVLKTITPLYGHGYDTKTPQFRLTELKALMRFTLRAVYGYEDTEKLYKEESALFGRNSDQTDGTTASPIRFRIEKSSPLTFIDEPILFHRKTPEFKYLKTNIQFQIQLLTFGEDLEEYKKWLELSLTLFGLGGRARRARGSFAFKSKYFDFSSRDALMETLCSQLNEMQKDAHPFVISHDKIVRKEKKEYPYPVIQSIQIGEDYLFWKTLLQKIDRSSSDYCSDYTGYARDKKRYASPVYVSGVELQTGKVTPIIIRLSCRKDLRGDDLSGDFIARILNSKGGR